MMLSGSEEPIGQTEYETALIDQLAKAEFEILKLKRKFRRCPIADISENGKKLFLDNHCDKAKVNEQLSTDKSKQSPAYGIAFNEGILDEATANRYGELVSPTIGKYGGHFIVADMEPTVLEGKLPSGRLTMVEFPSKEHAKAWYNSPDYAPAHALVPTAYRGRLLVIVEGIKTSE
jgi:uncharacterized protein (DUF1330 family)